MAALALGKFVLGYVVDLADDNSEVDLGSPAVNGGAIDVPCLGKFPSVTFMFPTEQKGLAYDGYYSDDHNSQLKPMEIEFAHVPKSCVGKRQHAEPCVNHDPLFMSGPFGSNGPSMFHLRLAHPGGNMMTTCDKPWNSWVEIDYVKVDEIVKTNCTLPSIDQIIASTGYNNQDGSVVLTATIMHGSLDGTLTEIPWMGATGGNVISIVDMLTPPQSPNPPSAPSPPGTPFLTGPGNLYQNGRRQLMSYMDFGGHETLSNLCWSSERGDSWTSNVWHSMCNGKGYTMYLVKLVYSGTQYVSGAWTRQTWAGGGYTGDTNNGIFQLQPNLFKTLAGTGPHGNYGQAMYRSNNYGPTYGGGHDWSVSSNMKTGYNNFGHNYKCRTGNYGQNTCKYDLLGHYSSWSIAEAEMWSQN